MTYILHINSSRTSESRATTSINLLEAHFMAASIFLFSAIIIFFKHCHFITKASNSSPRINRQLAMSRLLNFTQLLFKETNTKSVKFLHPLKSNSTKLLQKANIKTTCLWNDNKDKRQFQFP